MAALTRTMLCLAAPSKVLKAPEMKTVLPSSASCMSRTPPFTPDVFHVVTRDPSKFSFAVFDRPTPFTNENAPPM